MTTLNIPLSIENDKITLKGYLLEDSPEYRSGEKKPAVLICPGGGYMMTSDRESDPVALRFLAKGIHAFVLTYSTKATGGAPYPRSLTEAAKAMSIIREMSDKYLIDEKKIAVCGFSAGGNLAGLLATQWHMPFLSEALGVDNRNFRPDFLISGYGMLDYVALMELAEKDPHGEKEDPWGSKMGLWRDCNETLLGSQWPGVGAFRKVSPAHHVSEHTPPAFLWHTMEDDLVYVQNSMNFAAALTMYKIPYELHIFEKGGHGLSLCDETSAADEWQIDRQSSRWMDL